MNFLKLPQVKDYRNKLHRRGRYEDYGIKSKTHIVLHHSLTKTGSAEAYARHHVDTNKWPEIAYHFVIEQDGTIKWCHDLGKLSYHVGNSNRFSVGICMTGDFRYQQPTKEQYDSMYKLVAALMKDLSVPIDNVRGHQEFSQYTWKQCPALDMDAIRGNLLAKHYVPVRNNFNNDLKIVATMPEIEDTERVKMKEEDMPMELSSTIWQFIEGGLYKMYEDGKLDIMWYEKAAKRELTVSELAAVHFILDVGKHKVNKK